jgi:RNA recognition motif-containing protein
MIKSLFVGNLPWSVRDEELKALFEQHAPVISARVITERDSGRSRGFGFVEVDAAHVQALINALNGYVLMGRPLTVNEALPRENRVGRQA